MVQCSERSYSSFDRSKSTAVAHAFVNCRFGDDPSLFSELPALSADDELAMLVVESSSYISDKVVHGIVAFISTLGFEMLMGHVHSNHGRVSFYHGCFRLDDTVTGTRESDMQIFTSFFKRPPPRTRTVVHKPIPDLLLPIQFRLFEIISARSADTQTCLCSEDLAGIQELVLLPSNPDPRNLFPSDYPPSESELRRNHRLFSQPLQGFGHRPFGQSPLPLQYKLVIIGVNQAGFLSFVHMMLMLSHFRIIEAEIETMRGSYAHNAYVIETFCPAAERLLRAHFQCIVPVRMTPLRSHPFYNEIPLIGHVRCGVWLEDGLAGFYGNFKNGVKHGFGRFWRCSDRQSLASYSYEGDFVDGSESGFGYRLESDEQSRSSVSFVFGKFLNGKLIDGCVLYPFEPPGRSLRIDPAFQPDQCVYKVLIQRAEHWRRQLPREERPDSYLPASKLRDSVACNLRSAWTLFSESPVPSTSSVTCWQLAALLDMVGLQRAAKLAFAKRIDGGLLEAMSDAHLESILNLHLESQRCMFVNFMSTLARAQNIDRHMRQPAAVLDPLVNPSVGGQLLPLDRMRMVDSLGEGAYGKVMYAEFLASDTLTKTTSETSIHSGVGSQALSRTQSVANMRTPPGIGSVASEPCLFSVLTRRSVPHSRANMYVALKEQIGSQAQLENSCELIREWATLNALPHENIVKLEGICADANAPLFNKRYLATALIEASLPSLIYNADGYGPAPDLTPLLTIQLAGDIASGLAHMHSLHLLHGDIKSPNVLVDLRTKDRPVGRLCDFGHAAIRVGPRPQRRMCTFGWASPESLRDGETDTSADVWSWATVVWEMYVKEMPWKACTHAQMVVAVGHCGLDPSGQRGVNIPERVKAERKMAQLCRECWSLDPLKRPTMEKVLHVVDKLGRKSASRAVAQLQSLLQ